MTQPFVGEIRIFGGNFAPSGWAFCNGQLMAIAQNSTLFNLIGTTYGGDGQTTFALPNLQSQVPVHQGTNQYGSYVIGQSGGSETVTVTTAQLPEHNHALAGGAGGNTGLVRPGNHFPGPWSAEPYAAAAASPVTMSASAVGPAGGSQPHDNMIPFLAVSFIISLFGIYPSQ